MELGKRLLAIANFIKQDAKIADVGTDHAKLPVYLLNNNKISYAIAGDKNEGPLYFARENISRAGLKNVVDVRLGDGLNILKPNEVDTIIIAGMGGILITEILSNSKNILEKISQIILQPMNEGNVVRKWLEQNDFIIENEVLVKEDNRIYEIISAIKGTMNELNDMEAFFGPVILKTKNELLKERIKNVILKEKRKILGMEKSKAALESKEYFLTKTKLKQLEEILW